MRTDPISELDAGREAIESLMSAAGATAIDRDDDLLLRYAQDTDTDEDAVRVAAIREALWNGFFRLAAVGHAFVPVARFEREFGRSIDDNYRGAGPEFCRLATSYWTLRMLEGRVALRFSGVVLQQLLRGLEQRVREEFFRDPEEDPLSSRARAARQRHILRETESSIDAEAFLIANPLLVGNPLAD